MAEKKRRGRGRLIRVPYRLGLLASAAALVGIFSHALSLASHFQAHLALAWALGAGILYLFPRAAGAFWNPRLARRGAVGLALLHAMAPALLWIPRAAPDFASPTEVKVAWFNARHNYRAVQSFARELAADPPDIIAIGEFGEGIPEFEIEYPHFARSPNSGLMLYSKHPLQRRQIHKTEAPGRDVLGADVVVGARRFRLLIAHTRTDRVSSHGAELRELGRLAAAAGDTLLLGDLNATPWSPHYRELLDTGGFAESRRGFGLLPSWGPRSKFPLGLPIDHILGNGRVVVTELALMPWTASDHRPLRATVLVDTQRGARARGED